MNPLEDFLRAQRDQGVLESTGQITLDPSRALDKLARHQLQHPGLWLVKMVQAAVSGGASSLSVRVNRRRLRVAFSGPAVFDCDQILEELFSGRIATDWTTRHLVTGMRASLARVPESMSFAQISADKNRQFVIRPDGTELGVVETLPATITGETTYLFELHKAGEEWKLGDSLRATLTQTVDEIGALTDRCWMSPIPIRLDGYDLPRYFPRLVGTPPPGAFFASEFHLASPSGLGFCPNFRTHDPSHEDEPGVFVDRTPQAEGTLIRQIQPAEADPLGPFLGGGSITQYWPPPKPVPVYFCHHGVVVEQDSLTQTCPGLELYLSVEGLDFDLSTMKVVRDQRFEGRFQQLVQAFVAHQPVMHRYMHSLTPPVPWTKMVGGLAATGAVYLGVLGGPGAGLFGAVSGAVGGAVLGALARSRGDAVLRTVNIRLGKLRGAWRLSGQNTI
ncbi:MAG: hypothetical protein KC910_05595 [Candidatus Eremiobacteraeota bacterium]|nr:hypothetical protein [Candidatus Eremiobacteraeota bacterium]